MGNARSTGQMPLLSACWIAVAALLLAACTPEDQDAAAREAAKRTVTPILAARFPGLPVTPVANCVIDNATAAEIITLATASVTGVTPAAQQTTTQILARPGTIDCIARQGLSGALL
ncbi:MAG: hypothetical protein AAGB10_15355 [Pseudomonadota bacterium]